MRKVIKAKRPSFVKHVARMYENKNAYRALKGKPEGKGELAIVGIDGMMTLKWNLQKQEWRVWP
jgi:hypothetical protein